MWRARELAGNLARALRARFARERYAPFPDEVKLAFDRQIQAVLESIDDGFISLNSHWCFTYVNRVAESILQKKRQDLLGKKIWEVFPEVVGTVFWKKYYEAADTQSIIHVDDV